MTATPNSQSDAALVTACLQGDKVAFGRLVERHIVRVRRIARAQLRNDLHVDDVVQDAFLQAYLNLTALREPRFFGAWTCGIATNLARVQRRGWRETVAWDALQLAGEGSVEVTVEMRERLRSVYEAIDRLPSAERAAIWYVYRDGMSLKETAARLDITLSAAKVRVHRGRRRLRQQFMEQKMIPVHIHHNLYVSADTNEPPRPINLDEYIAVRRAFLEWQRAGLTGEHGERTPPAELARLDSLKKAVILLQDQGGRRSLPIWIRPTDLEQIAWAASAEAMPLLRPLTVDLLETLLDAGGVRVEQMGVSKLHRQIFYGTLTIETDNGRQEIDCRPSDGILLALRKGAPLFVDEDVMAEAGKQPDERGHFDVLPQ